jgi:hypothetical protein
MYESALVPGAGVSGSSPLVGSLFCLQIRKNKKPLMLVSQALSAVDSIQKDEMRRPTPLTRNILWGSATYDYRLIGD